MPRRRRQGKRRRAVDPELFLNSDGMAPFFTGDDIFENAFLARAAWEQVRAQTWCSDIRGIWPPYAATVYDHITQHTHSQHPTSRGTAWDLEIFCAAVEVDVASVAAFRENEPAKAATIVEALDDYLADLGMLRSLAEQLGDDRSEFGYAHVLRNAWSDFEIRRRRDS